MPCTWSLSAVVIPFVPGAQLLLHAHFLILADSSHASTCHFPSRRHPPSHVRELEAPEPRRAQRLVRLPCRRHLHPRDQLVVVPSVFQLKHLHHHRIVLRDGAETDTGCAAPTATTPSFLSWGGYGQVSLTSVFLLSVPLCTAHVALAATASSFSEVRLFCAVQPQARAWQAQPAVRSRIPDMLQMLSAGPPPAFHSSFAPAPLRCSPPTCLPATAPHAFPLPTIPAAVRLPWSP